MTDSEQEKPEVKSRSRWFIENLTSVAIALILVLGVRSSIIEAYKIPSGSMIPTLLIGDHIFVNKLAYGLTLPFSEWFGDPIYLVKRDPPKRGDIIVFKYPKDPSIFYIKRVVGTPGDVVELKDKQVYINSEPLNRNALEGEDFKDVLGMIDYPKYEESGLSLFRETMAEDKRALVMLDENNFSFENFGPITVPEGRYFVMGDNRDHSNDSRFWGFVPMENVKGKAVIIWLSLWLDFDAELFFFRPSRMGDLLE